MSSFVNSSRASASLRRARPAQSPPDLLALQREIEAELDRRTATAVARWTQFEGDPVRFVEIGLLGFLWSKQKLIAEALFSKNRRVAVPSCHDAGKSFLAASLACHWLSTYPMGEAFVVTLAPTGHQVRAILWREINRLHAAHKLPGYVTQTEWKTDKGELIGFGRSPKDTDPTAIQGIHAKYVLVIYDEGCGVAKALYDAASTMAANEFSAELAIGNPDDPSSEFAQLCKPGSGWTVIPISAFDTPNFTDEVVPDWLRPLLISPTWVETRKRKWGEGSPIYQSKVLGKFPEQAKDGLVPLSALTAAITRVLELGQPEELGVDVARFGDNFTSGYKRSGPVFQRQFRYQGKDTMVTVGHIMATLRANPGIRRVKIDDTGVGGGVTDRLKELKRAGDRDERGLLANVMILGINVGEAPTVVHQDRTDPDKAPKARERYTETERFFNLRAQLNWGMRERFIAGDICILDPVDTPGMSDDDLLAQAGDIRYTLTSRGHIQIEPKEDMEKRGRPSPDDWDALVLAAADGIVDPVLDIYAQLARG